MQMHISIFSYYIRFSKRSLLYITFRSFTFVLNNSIFLGAEITEKIRPEPRSLLIEENKFNTTQEKIERIIKM